MILSKSTTKWRIFEGLLSQWPDIRGNGNHRGFPPIYGWYCCHYVHHWQGKPQQLLGVAASPEVYALLVEGLHWGCGLVQEVPDRSTQFAQSYCSVSSLQQRDLDRTVNHQFLGREKLKGVLSQFVEFRHFYFCSDDSGWCVILSCENSTNLKAKLQKLFQICLMYLFEQGIQYVGNLLALSGVL